MKRGALLAAVLACACEPSLSVTFLPPAALPSSPGGWLTATTVVRAVDGFSAVTCDDYTFGASRGTLAQFASQIATSGTTEVDGIPRLGRKLVVVHLLSSGGAASALTPLDLFRPVAAGCAEVGDITSPGMQLRIEGELAAFLAPHDVQRLGESPDRASMRFHVVVRDAFGRPLSTRLSWEAILPAREMRSGAGTTGESGFAELSIPVAAPGPLSVRVFLPWSDGASFSSVVPAASVETEVPLPPSTTPAGAGILVTGSFGPNRTGAAAGLMPIDGPSCDGGTCWLEVAISAGADAGLRVASGPRTWPPGTALVRPEDSQGRLMLAGAPGASFWQPLTGALETVHAVAMPATSPSGLWLPACGRAPQLELVGPGGARRFDLGGRELSLLPPGSRTSAAGCLAENGADGDKGGSGGFARVSSAALIDGPVQHLELVSDAGVRRFATALQAPLFDDELFGGRFSGDQPELTVSAINPFDGGLATGSFGAISGTPVATATGNIGGVGAGIVVLSRGLGGELTLWLLTDKSSAPGSVPLASFEVEGADRFVSPALGVADFDGDRIDDIAIIGQGSATVPARVRVYRMGVRAP